MVQAMYRQEIKGFKYTRRTSSQVAVVWLFGPHLFSGQQAAGWRSKQSVGTLERTNLYEDTEEDWLDGAKKHTNNSANRAFDPTQPMCSVLKGKHEEGKQ
jgi:hypothetical protein